jgi:hypothetical protein
MSRAYAVSVFLSIDVLGGMNESYDLAPLAAPNCTEMK